MSTPKLLLIRHGATIDNQSGRLMGRNDAPLTEEAKRDATELGRSNKVNQYLDGAKVIWASPLPRAFDTAVLLVGDRDIEIEAANALTERDFGVYNGRILNELWESDPDWKAAEGDHTVSPTDGESLADVELRVFPFLTQLHETIEPDQHLIVVGHSTVWRLVAAALNKRREFPLVEKIAGPLSVQEYPRDTIELLLPIIDELHNAGKDT